MKMIYDSPFDIFRKHVLCLSQWHENSFFRLGKNSSVTSLYKHYTIACQNVTTEQVYFLVTNIDFFVCLSISPLYIQVNFTC